MRGSLYPTTGAQDPDPGWKKSRIRDEHPRSYFVENFREFLGLEIFKFCDADPDPGSCQTWIRDRKKDPE
jgi:hypothetical protein